MANERLKDFPAKTTPVPADIVYVGDSADSFNEVQSTIAQIISAYPILSSLGGLSAAANKMAYFTSSTVMALTDLSAFARTILDDTDASTVRTTLGLGAAALLAVPIPLASGGTAANLTAANGAIPYSTASAFALLAADSSGQLFQSGGAGAPNWTTATYPGTAGTSGNVLVSNGTNFSSSATTGITALGAQAQALNMNTHLINGVVDPVSLQDAATKNYVDSVAQGRIFKDPCVAATTGAFSATYANGSSGVGATLTGTVMAAFAPDGVTLAIGDRVLFKDQGSSFQNGIYTTTTLGTGAVLPVFTRATDMDLAAEFKGATTFIIGGTLNAARTYTETATVVTIGTDAVTFALTGDAAGSTTIVVQVISATGTYTPTTGMVSCVTQIVSGGASGGGVAGTVSQGAAGTGGAGGAYAMRGYTAAQIGASAAVVIGAGGVAGTAGNNPGNAGGTSSFTPAGAGTVLSCTGGVAGSGTAASATIGTTGAQPAGGVASGGQINIDGQVGTNGWWLAAGTFCSPGNGGSSHLGLGGLSFPFASASALNGAAGSGYGAGGCGAGATITADRAGGAGTNGVCIVIELVSV